MHGAPAVVIKKGGFLGSLALGVFGTLTAAIVCGSGLGIYALNIMDRKAGEMLEFGQGVVGNLPEIAESLPPVLSDALSDRRDPTYRKHVDATVRVVPSKDGDRKTRILVEVTNNGPETVTMMSAAISLEDEGGVPIRDFSAYVATPIAIENEWRGPLMPGSTRRFAYNLRSPVPANANIEITDLRVWDERVSMNAERP